MRRRKAAVLLMMTGLCVVLLTACGKAKTEEEVSSDDPLEVLTTVWDN